MAGSGRVNSALRVIDLLQSMNRRACSTLHELHLDTGIPKPTIVRLLQTLSTRDIVQHAPQYGAYLLGTQAASLSSGYHGTPKLVQAAIAPLNQLTATVRWPVAIATFDRDAMVVRYSTIPLSPLSLLQSSVNMRLSMTDRALGRAYLAWCTPQEQQHILAIIQRTEAGRVLDTATLQACLAQVRADGYALRDPTLRPVSSTIAIPVFEHGHVVAAIGLTWISSSLSRSDVVARYLRPLQHTAAAIGRNLLRISTRAVPLRPSSSVRRKTKNTPIFRT